MISAFVLLVAAVVAAGALAPPVAERTRLPLSVVYALAGLGLGLLGRLLAGGAAGEVLAAPPISAEFFLHALLPILLFHGALGIDIHRMREDALPILLLAILAVVVAILGIGFALWPLAGMPLVACFLLASVVATTDPVAVISIFRGVGAPERLTRLVEGESLFNDAAAVAFFLAFTALILSPGSFEPVHFAESLVLMPLGGGLVGWLAALAALRLPRRVREERVAFASISLALPFLVFWVAEVALHVSGILAVVAAGVTLATRAPGCVAPAAWRYAEDVWETIGDAATVLIFVLTALLAPRLMAGWTVADFGLLVVLILAALAARAAILLGLFPILTRLRAMPDVPRPYRLVALWGGLRGSMTLVLALAVTENAGIPEDVRGFVAALATAFTFVTLFVQGPTLRPLIQRLGLDRLSGVDTALRDLALTAARRSAAAEVAPLAARLGTPVETALETGEPAPERAALAPGDRLAAGLAALSARERALVLERFEDGLVTPRVARRLLGEARRRLDLSRVAAAAGYAEADARETAFAPLDRAAIALQRRLGAPGLLAHRLAGRFEALTETLLVVDALAPFATDELGRVLGPDTAAEIAALLRTRAHGLERALEALRLQYPRYAEALGTLIVARAMQARERRDIAGLGHAGVINAEVRRELEHEQAARARAFDAAPPLDLGLDGPALIDACPLFDPLSAAEKAELARMVRPFFAAPGDRLITKGARGTEAFFISSGAVEVDTGAHLARLGRGDVFGEMALLFDLDRQADVTAIGYSALLRLSAADFARFLAGHPGLDATLREIGARRLADNAGAQPSG